jgi:hypothetical protein
MDQAQHQGTQINHGTTRTQVITRQGDETKASFKTTELIVFIAAVAGVLIAAMMDDSITTQWAWILVSALAIGYMLSRGLAKSGSRHLGDDNSR